MKPLVVGLTGGFATGKSTVARMFRKLGAKVLDCDRIAHQALTQGTPTYFKIVKQLGPHAVCSPKGMIDRKKLGRIVFGNPLNRKKLERIIHPFVFREIGSELKAISKGVVILEVPLLFETRFDKRVDKVIVVSASRSTELARIRKKFRLSFEEARRRVAAQMPLSKKKTGADFVIENNRSLKETALQVKRLWKKLQDLSSGTAD